MKISVIIPTLNRPADIERALNSIAAQKRVPEELIVVDQADNHQTRDLLEAFRKAHGSRFERILWVHQEAKSLVKARNRGMDEATGDILSFLDDDVVLYDDYYFHVEHCFWKHPYLGGLSGNTLLDKKPHGFKWEGRKLLLRLFLLNRFNGCMTSTGFGYPVYEREIDRPFFVEMLPGCNMNFRRSFIGSARFDEWFVGYSYREDAEFSYQISRVSRLMMLPTARLHHYHSPSGRMNPLEQRKMEIKNYRHVAVKHKGGGLWARFLFGYSMIGLALISLIEFLDTGDVSRFRRFQTTLNAWFSGE
jgi:glycosyltransferase involved in cell wall biosynthesis